MPARKFIMSGIALALVVPGRVFESRVEFIYPYAERQTHTTRIRMVLDNSEGLLKPDMFADVTIATQRQLETLVVPT